jgi:hypothetical protein
LIVVRNFYNSIEERETANSCHSFEESCFRAQR